MKNFVAECLTYRHGSLYLCGRNLSFRSTNIKKKLPKKDGPPKKYTLSIFRQSKDLTTNHCFFPLCCMCFLEFFYARFVVDFSFKKEQVNFLNLKFQNRKNSYRYVKFHFKGYIQRTYIFKFSIS